MIVKHIVKNNYKWFDITELWPIDEQRKLLEIALEFSSINTPAA